MTDGEYAAWRDAKIASYADEMVEAGTLAPDAARERSERQFAEYLPEGLATPGVHLLRVLDAAGEPVGALWLGPHPNKEGAGWVYDIGIDEPFQGTGYGRGAMLAAEAIGRREGWAELGLNVFGPNVRARGLYDSLGYRVTATNMAKSLA